MGGKSKSVAVIGRHPPSGTVGPRVRARSKARPASQALLFRQDMSWMRHITLLAAREERKEEGVNVWTNERKQKGGMRASPLQNDGNFVPRINEATTDINWTSAPFPTPLLQRRPVRLAWTACLRQLGCGGTFLNHGLGKPPRLRVLAIGSLRLAASWSWASSEARLPQGLSR